MSTATVSQIYVLRHGETDWNRAQRLQDTINTPLNRIGAAQAHQVADRFRALAGFPTIERAFPGAVIDGHLQSDAFDVGGGEALAAAYCRASTALRRLVSASRGAPVVVVGHGVIDALLMCAAVGHVPAHMAQYTQPNGWTYRLQFRRGALVTVDCAPQIASWSNAAISRSHPWPVTV